MAHRSAMVEAQLLPDRNMVLVIGVGFDELFLPDFTAGRLCYGGPDVLYLMSDGGLGHDVHVMLEAWDAEPEPAAGDLTDSAVLTLTRPGIYVSRLTESAASPVLELPAPGVYLARVSVSGRRALPAARAAATDGPRPTERVLVQLWAAPDRPQITSDGSGSRSAPPPPRPRTPPGPPAGGNPPAGGRRSRR